MLSRCRKRYPVTSDLAKQKVVFNGSILHHKGWGWFPACPWEISFHSIGRHVNGWLFLVVGEMLALSVGNSGNCRLTSFPCSTWNARNCKIQLPMWKASKNRPKCCCLKFFCANLRLVIEQMSVFSLSCCFPPCSQSWALSNVIYLFFLKKMFCLFKPGVSKCGNF